MKINFQKVISEVGEAKSLVTNRASEDDKLGAKDNLEFYKGNHLGANLEYWTGPQSATPGDPAFKTSIKREFSSKNVIKEGVKGHRDGCISREPQCDFTVKRSLGKKGDVIQGQGEDGTLRTITLEEDEQPNTDEAQRIREGNTEVLTNWWNERDILSVLQEFTTNLLNTRRGCLRFYIPSTELVSRNDGSFAVPKAKSLEEALSKIYLLSHDYSQAGVFRDEVSMKSIGVYVTEEEEQTAIELTYLAPDGRTVIQTLVDEKSRARVPNTPQSSTVQSIFSEQATEEKSAGSGSILPLGGRLMMHEASLPEPFVSPQMRESNMSVNKTKTLRGHVINEAGFPETSLLNAEIPGVLEDDASRPGGKKFVPDPIQRGVNVFNAWQGLEYTDDDGKKHVANPSIHTRDIPSLQAFIECERADYQDILEESGQSHKLMAGDATASALSRIQAKASFGVSLLPTVSKLNTAIRWVGETALTLAAVLMETPDRYADLRMNADCRIDTGPVLPEEITVGLTLVEKKVWSRARLQRLTGVEDTQAEDEVILADEDKLRDPLTKVQTERANLNLEKDRAANGQNPDDIRDRIEKGVTDLGAAA